MIRLIGAGTRPGRGERVLETFWTIPNLITILRFLGVPLFVWLIVQDNYGAAFITLVIVGSTDWVDGYLARRLDQVSAAGKWLDPVADRLALIIVATVFVVDRIAPGWFIWAIVIPDIILIINSLILFRGSPNLPVSNIGKIRTALLLVGAPMLLLQKVPGFDYEWLVIAGNTVLVLGCIGHIAAFFGYLRASWQKHRRQLATAGDAHGS
ncbi:CDP-alcohol phosphatidyltransferase family protein [Arthrobacter koreensis]|uniref:CDP-alcohol phosphatidyltransferase family protein n=1 Tax=Arthrobacter koreensis TaxID=199136 RepID=UPI002DBE4C57|nr:CDP-alcohol phosphatidyltransferase family protein [Arthrobacter koreensis]MEB7505347.1 CDP-alcohol phosphatidyltransferase family protein [Arthrobacter koreensis]